MVHLCSVIEIDDLGSDLLDISVEATMMMEVSIRAAKLWSRNRAIVSTLIRGQRIIGVISVEVERMMVVICELLLFIWRELALQEWL